MSVDSKPRRLDTQGPDQSNPWRHGIGVALGAAVAALWTASLAGVLSQWWPMAELTTHFAAQYAVLAAVLTALSALLRRWRVTLAAGVCLLWHGVRVAVWFIGAPQPGAGSDGRLRIFAANVQRVNRRYDLTLQAIHRYEPDIVALIEPDAAWLEAMRSVEEQRPHTRLRPRDDNFGLALYSSRPLRKTGVAPPRDGAPLLDVCVEVEGRPLRLILAHPRPPVSARGLSERDEQLRAVADAAKRWPMPMVVIGDLNITMWSPVYRRMSAEGGFRNARQGFGIQPTWLVDSTVFALPVDHCLVTEGIQVADFRVGPDIGSDHRPVIVDLALSH